jgi:hypothetical protein
LILHGSDIQSQEDAYIRGSESAAEDCQIMMLRRWNDRKVRSGKTMSIYAQVEQGIAFPERSGVDSRPEASVKISKA